MNWDIPEADTYFRAILDKTPEGFEIPHLQEALRFCRDQRRVALDVGAHIGTWTVNLAKMFDLVVAFEPAYDTFNSLDRNTKGLKNVIVRNIAIGAHPGWCQSVDDPTRLGNTGSRMVKAGGGQVRMRPLDHFEFTHVDFIKIDVEGYELEVLKGAVETIHANKPTILMECKEFNPPRNGGTALAVAFLANLGYRSVGGLRNDRVFRPL